MKVKFKGRRKFKNTVFKVFIILLITIISFGTTFKVLYSGIKVSIDNKTYLDYLVNDSFSKFSLSDFANLSSTEFLLKYSFGITNFNTGLENIELSSPVASEVEDDVETNIKPTVYIYNSH